MQVTFFNAHPPYIQYSHDAFNSQIGKEVNVKRDGKVIGTAIIKNIVVQHDGVYFTYETDVNFGIEIDLNDFSI